MPRQARKMSKTEIYHIMLRGINKQVIFEDDEDRQKLLETIKYYKTVSKYEIYGYCIMSNHVHLLIKEIKEPLSLAIKRICGSYVYWYNWKYERSGHLFQERFKSEVVESEEYLLTVIRYIHQNPIKAGISKTVLEYSWSSYNEYVGRVGMIDVEFALGMFSCDKKKAIDLFKKYSTEQNEDKCLENEEKLRVSDNEAKAYFLQMGLVNISELQQLEKHERNRIIKSLKCIDGVTIRQLSRLTGISKSVIDRI